jgi:hypothetical protein
MAGIFTEGLTLHTGFTGEEMIPIDTKKANGAEPQSARISLASMLGTPSLASVASIADSLAIPVTAAYVAKATGSDAEALTLADGVPGQVLTVSLDTDGGGDGTLTPATSTGWATAVFADAGDSVTFKYINDTVGWVVIGSAGVAAPPVISV